MNIQKSLSAILTALLLLVATTAPAEEKAVVTAPEGLRMRSGPSLESKKLLVIPFNEEVAVIGTEGDDILIAGRKGKWTHVRWQGNTGWVFSGFLAGKTAPGLGFHHLKDLPEHWLYLTKKKGLYVIHKPCFADIISITLDHRKGTVTQNFGQESSTYEIENITRKDNLYTIAIKKGSHGGAFTFTVEYDRKRHRAVFTGPGYPDEEGLYADAQYRKLFKTDMEAGGNCGEP